MYILKMVEWGVFVVLHTTNNPHFFLWMEELNEHAIGISNYFDNLSFRAERGIPRDSSGKTSPPGILRFLRMTVPGGFPLGACGNDIKYYSGR